MQIKQVLLLPIVNVNPQKIQTYTTVQKSENTVKVLILWEIITS